MAIGTSLVLIAVGAVLRYAVTLDVSGIRIETVGGILMIVGVIGLAIALAQLIIASRRDDVAIAEERRYERPGGPRRL